MGVVMIKCPNTGQAISTGMAVDQPKWDSTPVFFSRTLCPICRVPHEWFAKEAWVCEEKPRKGTEASRLKCGWDAGRQISGKPVEISRLALPTGGKAGAAHWT
jgi:hypothetical protein